jgi:hypothetical protein
MEIEPIVSSLKEACDWVDGKKLKPGEGISCEVKFVDWGRKIYSPIFAFLWKTNVTGLLTMFPDRDLWLENVADKLKVSTSWVVEFQNACLYPSGTRTILTYSGTVPENRADKMTLAISKREDQVVFDKSALEASKYFTQKYLNRTAFKMDLSPTKPTSDYADYEQDRINKIGFEIVSMHRYNSFK